MLYIERWQMRWKNKDLTAMASKSNSSICEKSTASTSAVSHKTFFVEIEVYRCCVKYQSLKIFLGLKGPARPRSGTVLCKCGFMCSNLKYKCFINGPLSLLLASLKKLKNLIKKQLVGVSNGRDISVNMQWMAHSSDWTCKQQKYSKSCWRYR